MDSGLVLLLIGLGLLCMQRFDGLGNGVSDGRTPLFALFFAAWQLIGMLFLVPAWLC